MPIFDRLKAAKEERGEKVLEAEAIVLKAEKDNRGLTKDELASIKKLTEEDVKALDETITILETAEALKGSVTSTPSNGAQWSASTTSVDRSAKSESVIKVTGHKLNAFKSEKDAVVAANWFAAEFFGNSQCRQFCKDHNVPVGVVINSPSNALVTTDNNKGGVLVPNEVSQTIITLVEKYGIIRQFARREVMSTETKSIPRYLSGPEAEFIGENPSADIDESDMEFDLVTLIAKKIATLVPFSREFNMDSFIATVDQLTMHTGRKFAEKEDQCGFNGDGTSTYGGIVGIKNALAAGSISTSAVAHTSFATLDIADFLAMMSILPDYVTEPRWFITRAGYANAMQRLEYAAPGNTKADLESGTNATFLGYPVTFVNVMNKTLTAQPSVTGLAYFGDLAMAAALGDRMQMEAAVDASVGFKRDMLYFRAIERFGFLCHETGTATEAGPLVVLKTGAAS